MLDGHSSVQLPDWNLAAAPPVVAAVGDGSESVPPSTRETLTDGTEKWKT